MKERQAYLDIVKGWAITTVVLFHVSSSVFNGVLADLLGRYWNLPVFFVVAGFFLNTEKMMSPMAFLGRKFKRLYIPATITYLLAVLFHNVFVRIGWYPIGGVHMGTGKPFDWYGLSDFLTGSLRVLCCGGSGELIMGAMWFLYTLLYAFVFMCILWCGINRVHKLLPCFKNEDEKKRIFIMSMILLLAGFASNILTQDFGITISRLSPAVSASILIWLGYLINQRWHWQFGNHWALLASIILFFCCVFSDGGRTTMARNQYQDLVQLCLVSVSFVYIWVFLAKKICDTFIGKFFSYIGRNTLYIMMFHIMGFFICNSLLEYLGVFSSESTRGMYTYAVSDNWQLLLLYTLFGLLFPLLVIFIFRKLKSAICCLVSVKVDK